jgi:hypothetical protein
MGNFIYVSKHDPEPQEPIKISDFECLEKLICQFFSEVTSGNFVVEIDHLNRDFMIYLGFAENNYFAILRDFKSKDKFLSSGKDIYINKWFKYYYDYIIFGFPINLSKEDIIYIAKSYLASDLTFIDKYQIEETDDM